MKIKSRENGSIESSKSDNFKKRSAIFVEGSLITKMTSRFSLSLTSIKDPIEGEFKNPNWTPIFDPNRIYLSFSEFINSN